MLEYEKKVLLSKEEYDSLMLMAKPDFKPTIQTNYYYDSDELDMNRQGVTLRIRQKDGIYETTVKSRQTEEAECSTEDCILISNEYDDKYFKNLKLELQGCLVTKRIVLISEEGLEVVIDENTYLGTTDYELEIEYTPQTKEVAEKTLLFLAEFLFAYTKTTNVEQFCSSRNAPQNKSARFFERKQKIQRLEGAL